MSAIELNVMIGRPAWIMFDRLIGMPTSCDDDGGDLHHAGAEALGDALQVLAPLLASTWPPTPGTRPWPP